MPRISVHAGANTTRLEASASADLDAAGPTTLKLDLAVPGDAAALVEVVEQADLFATAHVVRVDHFEKLTADVAARIATAPSDAVIVGLARATFTKKLEKALGATVTKHAAPKGKAIATEVAAIAVDAGVTLDRQATALLADRCAADLARARSVCRQLADAGFTSPNAAQVEVLVGSTSAGAAPWDVTDAIDRHDMASAIAALRMSEPVPVAVWVHDHLLAQARILENGWSADQATSGLKVHRFRASNLVGAARRNGAARVNAALAIAAGLDRASKNFDATDRVAVLVARIIEALSR
ncbi:MAG: hypothetical protein GY882_01685 [Actinomycetia bacterium]|nr:hypothetical protein [Actinomycetes bacterium]